VAGTCEYGKEPSGSIESITATFADDTAILTVNEDPAEATHQLQVHLHNIHSWLKEWRIKANEAK
jgi:hypothetical protein